MEKDIKQKQINTTIALGIMRHLYNKGEISEKVYKKIIAKYGKDGLEKLRVHDNISVNI